MFPTPDTALTHILVVADPKRSRAWYTEVLGASVYREYDSSIVLQFGGTWLLLVEGGGPGGRAHPPWRPNPPQIRSRNSTTRRVSSIAASASNEGSELSAK